MQFVQVFLTQMLTSSNISQSGTSSPHQSLFLEALLVWQAEGELKKCAELIPLFIEKKGFE
jgi:hypothetical protein